MSLNFVQFINDNTSFTPEKNQAMLDSLANSFNYDSTNTELTKTEFVNQRLTNELKARINKQRRAEARRNATYTKFEIEEPQE